MKKINLKEYYPYYTQDMIVEVPDEVFLLLREYMLLEEAYRIRTYRYKAFYSLERDEGIEREVFAASFTVKHIGVAMVVYYTKHIIFCRVMKTYNVCINAIFTGLF